MFDSSAYELWDQAAKDKVKFFLSGTLYQPIENPDKYGIDLLIYKSGVLVAGCEVETKLPWSSGVYPWNDARYAVRKLRYQELPYSVFYITFCSGLYNHIAVLGKDLFSSPQIQMTFQREENEKFIVVDRKFIKLDWLNSFPKVNK